jgi:hypothetical protein
MVGVGDGAGDSDGQSAGGSDASAGDEAHSLGDGLGDGEGLLVDSAFLVARGDDGSGLSGTRTGWECRGSGSLDGGWCERVVEELDGNSLLSLPAGVTGA